MAKERFDRSKTHVNIGTIGYIDHGKTTLAAAITNVLAKDGMTQAQTYDQIDGASEKKEHGITINTTYAEYQTDKCHYVHVDYPGHAGYAKNMIIDVVQMDGVIPVAAASDGPIPQTREHIPLARQVGVSYIVIFLNKCDMVDDEGLIDLVEMEIRELLGEYGFDGDNVPVIRGFALKALEGDDEYAGAIKELMNAVDEFILDPTHETGKPFLVFTEDVMAIAECGTVTAGRVEHSVVKPEEKVEIIDIKDTQKTVVTGLEMLRKWLDFIKPGDNIGALLRGINRDQIQRGQVFAKPESVYPHTKFKVQVCVLTKEEGGRHTPFVSNYRPQLYFRATDVIDVTTLPEGTEMVMSGNNVEMSTELTAPIATENNTKLSIRKSGHTVSPGNVAGIIE